MRKFVLGLILFLIVISPILAQPSPNDFQEKLLQEVDRLEAKSKTKVGVLEAPKSGSLLGKVVVLDQNTPNGSALIYKVFLELGILEELTPGSSAEITLQSTGYILWFMAMTQKTTDGLEKGRFSLPADVICEEIKASGRTYGYFNPYGLHEGCSVWVPESFAEVRSLVTKHLQVMNSTWGIGLSDNFLPWNCPRLGDWIKPYGRELWEMILRYGLTVGPTDTPNPGRTSTATQTPIVTTTGTLTPQATATATRTPTAMPTPIDGKKPWSPFGSGTAIAISIMSFLAICGLSFLASTFATKPAADLAITWIIVILAIVTWEWVQALIRYYGSFI